MKIQQNNMFVYFLNPFIEEFKNKFKNQLSVCELISFVDINSFTDLYNRIYLKLFKMSIRALIRELHEARNNGLLIGNTKEERYDFFENQFKNPKFRDVFLEKYTVLRHNIKQFIDQTILYVIKIIKSFKSNKNILKQTFNNDIDKITDIVINVGDPHNQNQSVSIIKFKDIKLVYKPRYLKGDAILKKIVEWINNQHALNYTLSTANFIEINNIGWQEYIDHLPCNNEIEVTEYYYKIGCFLSIFGLLGTTDLHFENIIANGKNPIFTDLETIISNYKINRFNTILDTGLLPNTNDQDFFDIDISGLYNNKQASKKIRTLSLINPRTDLMHLKETDAIINNTQNIVFLKKKVVPVENYVSFIVDGYKKTSDFIINNNSHFLKIINSSITNNDTFRTVLRNTQIYSEYLTALSHPNYLADFESKNKLLNRLLLACSDHSEKNRVKSEIENLKNNVIPVFLFKYNSRNLYFNNNIIEKNYFPFTAKEHFKKRFNNYIKNRKANEKLVYKSLQTTFQNPKTDKKITVENSYSLDYNAAILKYAEEVKTNIFSEQESEYGLYYFNSLNKGKITLNVINCDMYEGGGIILYLASVGKSFNNDSYVKLADKLLNSSSALLKLKYLKTREILLSAFSGYGSLIYLNYLLYFLLNEAKYKENADKIVSYLIDSIIETKTLKLTENYEFLNGISGFIISLSYILLKEKNEKIDKLFKFLVHKLNLFMKKNSAINLETGLAHGLSGYAYAYTMIHDVLNEKKYLIKAKELLLTEDNMLNNKYNFSWCRGVSGICLTRLKFLEHEREYYILNKFKKSYSLLKNGVFKNAKNMCLCHGLYGNLEVLKAIENSKLSSHFSDRLPSENRKPVSSFLKNINSIDLGIKKDIKLDSFMTGISGILYSLLKEKHPYLPSILFLEI